MLLGFGEMYINIESQVVDNLVLLHSQSEGRSRIYDLQLVAKEPAAVEVNFWCIFPDFFLNYRCILPDFFLNSRCILPFFQVDGPVQLHPSLPPTAICRQVDPDVYMIVMVMVKMIMRMMAKMTEYHHTYHYTLQIRISYSFCFGI